MFPRINNKPLLECDEEDFDVLIDNDLYIESQYLEFKEDFTFLRVEKDKSRPMISEFRSDICSFANADGGYIIYGIRESNGHAVELKGVEIVNVDRFELNLRDKLAKIMPKIPPMNIRCVLLDNTRYLVVILIEHDYYAPYIHGVDESGYKIYKRDGNRKVIIGYTELKNMFTQSRVLEDEILTFREKRIDYYRATNLLIKGFVLFHIIPESFLNDRKPLFAINHNSNLKFSRIYDGTTIEPLSFPCVDGIRYMGISDNEQSILYNNGISEFYTALHCHVSTISEGTFLRSDDIWKSIESIVFNYRNIIPQLFGYQRYYGCITIIGGKGIYSAQGEYMRPMVQIDRDEIICQPVELYNYSGDGSASIEMDRLHLEFLLSLGIGRTEKVLKLIESIQSLE